MRIHLSIPLAIVFALPNTLAVASAPPLFLSPMAVESGTGTWESVLADLDGDGKPDLVVALPTGGETTNGKVSVLLGHGDGTFGEATTYDSGGNEPRSVAVGDLNGDGAPDIAIANFCVWIANQCSFTTVGVLLGHGDGTFEPAVSWNLGGNSTLSIAIADVNGDGKNDLLAPVEAAFGFGVALLAGNGDGTFQAPRITVVGSVGLNAIAVADINADGLPDVVIAGYDFDAGGFSHGVVGVLLGHGDGTFTPSPTQHTGGPAGGFVEGPFAIGDLNHDGTLDVAVANYPDGTTGVLLGNGDGSFQSVALHDSGARFAWSETTADVDGDGNLDLLVSNFEGTIGVLLGNGDGTFQATQTYAVPGDAISVVAADLNGDSRPDLVVATSLDTAVLLNDTGCARVPPVVTLSLTPSVLWPPNGKLEPVTLSGEITAAGCPINPNGITYAVQDEYGAVQPSGTIELNADGAYSLSIELQASRRGTDDDGRLYTLTVRAENNAGAAASAARTVTVPHSR
jgi:hypothetical protein